MNGIVSDEQDTKAKRLLCELKRSKKRPVLSQYERGFLKRLLYYTPRSFTVAEERELIGIVSRRRN